MSISWCVRQLDSKSLKTESSTWKLRKCKTAFQVLRILMHGQELYSFKSYPEITQLLKPNLGLNLLNMYNIFLIEIITNHRNMLWYLISVLHACKLCFQNCKLMTKVRSDINDIISFCWNSVPDAPPSSGCLI